MYKAKADFLWYKSGDVIDESKELPENIKKWASDMLVEEIKEAPKEEKVEKPVSKPKKK